MNIQKLVRCSYLRKRSCVDSSLLVGGLFLAMLAATSKTSAGLALKQTNDQSAAADKTSQSFEITQHLADVLQAIAYVEAHWLIDTNRIHLTGLSMGGGGVSTLAADYPHLFASGEIDAGVLGARPLNNLLTFPVYSIHSRDDPLAPIISSYGPLRHLRQLGGTVVFDETDGLGHDVWKYNAGHQRAGAWRDRQVRPDSRSVRRLDFAALSGAAARAWWAEVLEWGPAPRPAHFRLTAGKANSLRAQLTNITRLRLRIGESPFERIQPLRVTVGGAAPFHVPAPLPENLVLVLGAEGWHAETKTELPFFHLHTPGGPMLLYDGSPLLIVYGTRGDTNICAALRAAAAAATKSPNPVWAYDAGPVDGEGVPYSQNLYGRLRMKADHDVTDRDLQACHLVFIGTAEQNTVVARLAPQLPVQRTPATIACSDGLNLEATNRAFGLLYYNPLAPQRLISWVASDATNGYAAPLHFLFGPADFAVTDLDQGALVLARSFDSRWHWDPARATSSLLSAKALTEHDAGLAWARALQQATHADFGFKVTGAKNSPQFLLGTTRLADLLPYFYYDPVCLVELTGTEWLAAESRREAEAKKPAPKRLFPQPDLVKIVHPALDPARIEPARKYRMAMLLREAFVFGNTFKLDTPSFRVTDLEAADVLARFFLPNE